MAKRNTFSEDEIYDEKFDINQVKRLFHYVKPYRTQIALIAILMLSSSGLSMLIPTFFMKVMDDCIPMGMAGMKPILGYVAAILLITVYGMISFINFLWVRTFFLFYHQCVLWCSSRFCRWLRCYFRLWFCRRCRHLLINPRRGYRLFFGIYHCFWHSG